MPAMCSGSMAAVVAIWLSRSRQLLWLVLSLMVAWRNASKLAVYAMLRLKDYKDQHLGKLRVLRWEERRTSTLVAMTAASVVSYKVSAAAVVPAGAWITRSAIVDQLETSTPTKLARETGRLRHLP